MIIPKEEEFILFFESEATNSIPKEGYWNYTYKEDEVFLRFSFDIFEGSIQTVLKFKENIIETVSYEGAEKIRIEGNTLYVDFIITNNLTKLKLELHPIKITWSTLKME